ncbi:uncharacterized protein PHACADRAFT_207561 [Phanerochaete carnosa HHB-10118-sp]|uniref:Uncharacterized protein n=1 Tax=Phanerochaete carnosa (strain HHB-10118-sp) TaxID=650164 RepID=K5V1A9_PHACS|nr:uncharacterized protein PHACADRAFT_207561 [Phanerochaete carnosa HHB-10118-sp]EKM56281.1 hypothetical protein PHACADRAFT_207561 [Phanerochaete carnosa HHB-10118-sp]
MSLCSELKLSLVIILTRGSLLASDVIVLALTWVRSYKQFQQTRRLRLGPSIVTVLLRDGTIYFVALLGVNIYQLLTFQSSSTNGLYAESFIESMPPVLVQRFMLNLRQLSHASDEISSGNEHSSSRSVNFRLPSDFLGNIGESLDHGQAERVQKYDGDDDDDDDDDSNSDVAGERAVGLEEGSLQLEGSSLARRNEQIGVSLVPASHSIEGTSEGKEIEL